MSPSSQNHTSTSADSERFEQIRSTLAADGYGISAVALGDVTRVTVSSASGTCDDCLVPKELLIGMLQPALGVPSEKIELIYPDEING